MHLNSAKSFVGRTVNLHMKDGSVIVNVKVRWARKTLRGRELAYQGANGVVVVPISEIAHATPIVCYTPYIYPHTLEGSP